MMLMGWDGTQVTPQIRSLIEDHHLGSIILTAKNLKCKWPICLMHISHMTDELRPLLHASLRTLIWTSVVDPGQSC
jgi:beta-N-acetylhexosaminidase